MPCQLMQGRQSRIGALMRYALAIALSSGREQSACSLCSAAGRGIRSEAARVPLEQQWGGKSRHTIEVESRGNRNTSEQEYLQPGMHGVVLSVSCSSHTLLLSTVQDRVQQEYGILRVLCES